MTEMDTEPALTAAARFTAEVEDLQSFVESAIAAIQGLNGCWGTGSDGRAFAEQYEPAALQILSAMNALLTRFADTGYNSGTAILGAEATDEANAADLNGVGAEEA
jgi:hypothetical protein